VKLMLRSGCQRLIGNAELSYPDHTMPRISPTTEGFRAAFRRPALTLAEITWRWSVGATASALLLFGLIEYLRTLPVNNAELLLLRTRQPVLIGQAIAHILRGSLDRVALAAILAAVALSCLWMTAASLGRIASVRALLEYFATHKSVIVPATITEADGAIGDAASHIPVAAVVTRSRPLASLMGINFLRVAVALAAIFSIEGASTLAGFASPASNPQPGLAFFLFLPVAVLVCAFWCILNWFLSLAAVFVIRDAEDTLGALSAAVGLCRERTGPILAVSTWNVLAHLTAFIGVTIAVSLPMGLIAALPWRVVVACIILTTLMYFALVDWLYMARLAGYVCSLEMPAALLAPAPISPVPPYVLPTSSRGAQLAPMAPVKTTIDRDEPIMSDVPNVAVET
jgi:hypothetical protein